MLYPQVVVGKTHLLRRVVCLLQQVVVDDDTGPNVVMSLYLVQDAWVD